MQRNVIVILPISLVLRDRARSAHFLLATGHRQELSVGGGQPNGLATVAIARPESIDEYGEFVANGHIPPPNLDKFSCPAEAGIKTVRTKAA